MLEVLDGHLFLEGPRADAERARQRAAFLDAPASLPGRALHRRQARRPRGGGAGHFEAPDGRPIQRRGTSACRGSCAHIDFTRGGPAYAWAYRALSGPRRGLLHRPRNGHAGLDGHSFAASSQGVRNSLRPLLEVDREVLDAVTRARRTISSRPSSRTRASTPSVSGGVAPVSVASHAGGRATHRASRRELRPRVPASRQEPRRRAGHRDGAGGPQGAMATVTRRTASWRARISPTSARASETVAGGRDAARARRVGGPCALLQWSGRCRWVLRGGAQAAGPEPDLRPVAISPLPRLARRNGSAPSLRAVARSRRCGHVRERELRAGGDAPVTLPAPGAADPGLVGVFGSTAGAWRHDGVEVTHPGVLRNLYANLRAEG